MKRTWLMTAGGAVLSLSSLAIVVGIVVSTVPNAAGHLRSIPPPLLVEDNAHSYDKGATATLTKGTEEVNHNRVGRKLQKKKNNKNKSIVLRRQLIH